MAKHRRASLRAVLLGVFGLVLSGAQPRLANMNQRLLSAHNHERAAHQIAPLNWDRALAQSAQIWADELARTRAFKHSPTGRGHPREGENIWGGTPEAFTPEAMVSFWVQEKGHFVSGTFPRNSATGKIEDVSHYTQLVWRRTNAVGCGLSRTGDEEILVCRYSEAGNVRGYRPF